MTLTKASIPAILLLISTLSAQSRPANVAEGEKLATEWCQTCHAIREVDQQTDTAPPWSVVANDPEKTDSYLRAFLTMPQGPMKHISLTRQQIDNIIAYLKSLRRPDRTLPDSSSGP